MQWHRTTKAQRRAATMKKLRARKAAVYYDTWFAWYPVCIGGGVWAWLETVCYTEEWLEPHFCIYRYYAADFFDKQREAMDQPW